MKAPTMKQFREWGRQGGLARAKALSPRKRRAIAKLAVAAREAKRHAAS